MTRARMLRTIMVMSCRTLIRLMIRLMRSVWRRLVRCSDRSRRKEKNLTIGVYRSHRRFLISLARHLTYRANNHCFYRRNYSGFEFWVFLNSKWFKCLNLKFKIFYLYVTLCNYISYTIFLFSFIILINNFFNI